MNLPVAHNLHRSATFVALCITHSPTSLGPVVRRPWRHGSPQWDCQPYGVKVENAFGYYPLTSTYSTELGTDYGISPTLLKAALWEMAPGVARFPGGRMP